MRILIKGLGSIGMKHVSALKSIDPQAEIVALRSGRGAGQVPGILSIYSLNEIEGSLFDFAIISNPTSEHKTSISGLSNLGIPLFIEKPLCSSFEFKDIIDLVERKKIISYVACNLRFLECIRFIKDNVGNRNGKRLNEVNVYCGSYLPDWRPGKNFRESYSAIPEMGGGVHLDLIHELDYLYWLFDCPVSLTKKYRNQSSLCIKAVDYANLSLDYNGFCANVILNYYRRDPKRTLELVFEDQTWNVDLLKNKVWCEERILFESQQRISDTYRDQMEYFINCISQEIIPMNTVSDAGKLLKLILQ